LFLQLASNQSILLPFLSSHPQGAALGAHDWSVVDYGHGSKTASPFCAWEGVADSQRHLEGKLQPNA
jgi:hypothetical protein